MTKKFETLRREIRADPERRARVEQFKRAMDDALRLAELRRRRALSQEEVAEGMSVSQGRVSVIEHSQDWYLSTLGGYVAALGGRLRVTAEFDNEEVDLAVPAIDTVETEP
jgi:DNA-binding XRE family transcriptional regulator